MRQTCIGAIGSNVYVRLTHLRARVWTVALPFGLLCGQAQSAFPASTLSRDAYFVIHEAILQPGPSNRPSADPSLDSTILLASGSGLYSEAYWTAFADQDLVTLHQAARNGAEARFAEAMTLLAAGNYEGAESAFGAVSREMTDLNVAVAAQAMLAATLRYERKWTSLRDVALNSNLSAEDRKITSDLESWGKAFADAEPEVTTFPDKRTVLPLRITAVGTPVIQVRVNGKQYDFWLDTGSSMTVISSAVAAEARITTLSSDVLTVRTFAGSASVRAASVQRLEIGPILLTNSPAVIIDESLMYLRASAEGVPRIGLRVDGIIGWDTIRQFDLTMNYAAGWIALRQPIQRRTIAEQQNLAWLGRPFVEVRSKDAGSLHFTLDTGAQTTFLNATVTEKRSIATKGADNRVFGLARTARQTTRVVPFLSIDVGGKSLRLQDVIVYGPVASGLINSDGILGSDIANYGTIRIDASNGVFALGGLADPEDLAE